MNFKFAKTMLLGSAMALSTIGFVACGGESGTNAGPSANIPKENDAHIQFNNLKSAPAGNTVSFSGTITLDASDSNVTDQTVFQFDSVQVFVTTPGSTKILDVVPTITKAPALPAKNISLTQMGIIVDLSSEKFTSCGAFDLLVNVYATVDKDPKVRAADRISFNRADRFCPVASSSASNEPAKAEIEMASYEVILSTATRPGLNLATKEVSASTTADLVVVKTAEDVNITSGNGTLFAPISNKEEDETGCTWYSTGMWPEEVYKIEFEATTCPTTYNKNKVYVSDFKYKSIEGTEITSIITESAGQIYVAKTKNYNATTGAGFFAFAMTGKKPESNGDYTITLKVYKLK